MSAIDDVQAVETVWTTGRVIEKSLPTPMTVGCGCTSTTGCGTGPASTT